MKKHKFRYRAYFLVCKSVMRRPLVAERVSGKLHTHIGLVARDVLAQVLAPTHGRMRDEVAR